jgi:hypothetical protein
MLREHFDNIECVHQSYPNDFTRPSKRRIERSVGTVGDFLVVALGKTPLLKLAVLFLAWMHLTGRVSFRCTKK